MILLVAGTRPEIVKLAPVYANLQKSATAEWLWTGQQPDLGLPTFSVFNQTPEHVIDMDRPTGSLPELFSSLSVLFEQAYKKLKPELVVVQGDALSAAVGAMQAFLAKIPVAHVEAGLRSWDRLSPYPEEASRVWIDEVADYLFAPTQQASRTLSGENVWVTGNTGIDAVRMVRSKRLLSGTYAVVTLHRRENAEAVADVCEAVKKLAEKKVFDRIIWPVHPNPIVSTVVPKLLGDVKGVELVSPLQHDEMVNLMRYAKLLLTDSGGVQEEALALHIPCLVMRENTERPEGVQVGGAKLVGTKTKAIVGQATWLMQNPDEWRAMECAPNPYGDGRAGWRVAVACRAIMNDRKIPASVNWKGPQDTKISGDAT